MASLVEGIRARGAFLLRTVMDPPWSLRIEDEAPLAVFCVLHGQAWLTLDGDSPVLVQPGDVCIVRGPDHYVVSDDPETSPTIIIHPGQRCTTLTGEALAMEMVLGVRTWGNSARGATALVTGTYEGRSEIGRRLLDALPALVVVRANEWDSPLVELLFRDLARDDPGQEVVLDRLLDLLLIAVIRAWFARDEVNAPRWWRAQGDPVVGKALRLVYSEPAHSWTVDSLAAAAGVSRAAFARRFSELVGEPPIAFLTSWRLALAADLLRDERKTIGAVAREVGYSSPYALSTAFKRLHGISPHQHRLSLTTSPPEQSTSAKPLRRVDIAEVPEPAQGRSAQSKRAVADITPDRP